MSVGTRTYYSPLRYPGGKSWLVPTIAARLDRLAKRPRVFIEPFAGGASVGLFAILQGHVDSLMLVEKDDEVANLWSTIFSTDSEALVRKVLEFDASRAAVQALLNQQPDNALERAFRILVKNRVTFGGRISKTGGLLRNGERGNGTLSRWYPVTIATRIRTIARIRANVTVVHGDGVALMQKVARRSTVCMFVDPPYSVDVGDPGQRLYDHSEIDHEKVFRIAGASESPVFLTYPDTPSVRVFARRYGLSASRLNMVNAHHDKRAELLLTNI